MPDIARERLRGADGGDGTVNDVVAAAPVPSADVADTVMSKVVPRAGELIV